MDDYQERADELEEEAEKLEHEAERVEADIDETRSDWKAKQDSSAVPGAVPDPDEEDAGEDERDTGDQPDEQAGDA